jgi:hypothetical protein
VQKSLKSELRLKTYEFLKFPGTKLYIKIDSFGNIFVIVEKLRHESVEGIKHLTKNVIS